MTVTVVGRCLMAFALANFDLERGLRLRPNDHQTIDPPRLSWRAACCRANGRAFRGWRTAGYVVAGRRPPAPSPAVAHEPFS
jgi:hypothetical protein